MAQPTAVVLDDDQIGRDRIRLLLFRCGVVPICFDDEWICLENLYHVRPAFAVLRPISNKMTVHFISIARVIERCLPIIILSHTRAVGSLDPKSRWTNLFFLPDSATQKDLRGVIESFDGSTLNPMPPEIIAGSSATCKWFDRLPLIGHSNESVLIQGEPGVGKRLVARAIHNGSVARDTQLTFVPARTISEAWIRQIHQRIEGFHRDEEPLFYYVIENIEDLQEPIQSQLLLIMDALAASGNGDGTRTPIRFIFLAEVDLAYQRRSGQFREDLYHRLTVLKISVPSLRERREDVPLLADFFAAKYGLEKHGALVRLPEYVHAVFQAYHWPGNVAQLEGVIKKAMAEGISGGLDDLQQWCHDHAGLQCQPVDHPPIDVEDCLRKLMDSKQEMSLKTASQRCAMQVEKDILRTALVRTHGNCKKAAILLDISYKTMLNKVKEYRLVGGLGGVNR